jgi:hypothetical protein
MTIMPNETYLGDGLYARFNGFEFILRAPRENGRSNRTYSTPSWNLFTAPVIQARTSNPQTKKAAPLENRAASHSGDR